MHPQNIVYTEISDITTLQECFGDGTITRSDTERCNSSDKQLALAIGIGSSPDSLIGKFIVKSRFIWHFVDMYCYIPVRLFLVETADGSVYGLNLNDRDMLDLLFRKLFYPESL